MNPPVRVPFTPGNIPETFPEGPRIPGFFKMVMAIGTGADGDTRFPPGLNFQSCVFQVLCITFQASSKESTVNAFPADSGEMQWTHW